MKVKITMIEDWGITKNLHFEGVGFYAKGHVKVGDTHLWFNKEVGDYFTLSDRI